MPQRLTASEITVRLGTPWIDPQYIKQFIAELLEPNHYFVENTLGVTYVEMNAEWRIIGARQDKFNTKANETTERPLRAPMTYRRRAQRQDDKDI